MIGPWSAGALAFALLLYAGGCAAVWRLAGRCRGVTAGMVAAFAGGWLALLASQLPAVMLTADRLLSVHVLQHALLMLVAAPLLVVARTFEVVSWTALPGGWRRRRARRPLGRAAAAWATLSNPPVAWAIQAICVWAWHLPAAFQSALADPAVHLLQHASLLAAALLFWSACLRPARSALNAGLVILALFTTSLHVGALGALFAFSTAPWYAMYQADPVPVTATLGDQQLAGMLLAAAGGIPYILAAIVLMGQRVARRERRSAHDAGTRTAW